MPDTARKLLTPATRMGLSIAIATGLYGISFGALAVAAGLNLWQTVALSALMFTGGSQFAFIGRSPVAVPGPPPFTPPPCLGCAMRCTACRSSRRCARPRAWCR